MSVEDVVGLTERLLDTPAVVGFEGPLFDVIAGELSARGRTCARGDGIIVAPGAQGPALSAHIDRHGLIALGDGHAGYAAHVVRRERYGEHVSASARVLGQVCHRFADETVYAYDPATGERLARGRVAHGAVCDVEDLSLGMLVDGLDVPAGTPIAFEHACARSGDRFAGQLDNVLSAAIALTVIGDGFEGTVCFTAEEEIGRSWRHAIAAFDDAPGPLVVLDTSPFPDAEQATRGSVVLRNRDANAAFDPGLVGRLGDAARKRELPVVFKDELIAAADPSRPTGDTHGLGSTELGRIIAETAGRLTGATVQVPTFDYHTNHETTTVSAITNVLALLSAVL